ncbi:MAG: hypothetical protein BRC28_03690 [Nanohaloarchaea archaeon SW_4_43_9]|nr:MAG: hypothetical protein BRC28_03690 [Nanohaloarchaea archaeon SW_4_43_9]
MEGGLIEMEYTIKPDKHELEAVKGEIKEIIQKYSYSLKVENMELNLGWRRFEKDSNVISEDKTLTIIINPNKDRENLEKKVLRGLLEIEFMGKAEYEELRYNWQEIARMAYVRAREANLRDKEIEKSELENKWSDLKQELDNESEEFDENLYMNAGIIAESIGRVYREDNRIDKLPETRKSDIIKTGDKVFN